LSDVEIRYAASDEDVVAIHRYLCVMAGPTLPGQIDHKDSVTEVWRVVNHDIALMAVRDDHLVGTMGLMRPTQWWNHKVAFIANRWFFTTPGSRAGKPLLKEAKVIAVASGIELQIYDENKGRLVIFNRSSLRKAPPCVSPNQAPA
jgi:hypothetical protein